MPHSYQLDKLQWHNMLVKLKAKNRIWTLRGYKHHLTDSMIKLCHCGEHNNVGGKSIPMYYSSGGKLYLW